MKLRVRMVIDRVTQIADHTFDVPPGTTYVTVSDAGERRKPVPIVAVVSGFGRIETLVEFIE